jgi:hypothetical protein
VRRRDRGRAPTLVIGALVLSSALLAAGPTAATARAARG